jgi:Tol biopolymer transport system component
MRKAALLLALGLTLVAPAAAEARGGKILFQGHRDGGAGGIYTVNGDGHKLHRVPGTVGTDSNPVWSPDGRWIAFARDHVIPEDVCQAATGDTTCSEEEVYVMRPNGSGLRRITDANFRDPCSPTQLDLPYAWSPDGGTVLFGSSRWDGRDVSMPGTCNGEQLWAVPAAGGALRQVTRTPGRCQGDTAAAWSRLGRIALSSNRSCASNIWTIDPSGQNARRITSNVSDRFYDSVDYAPNGRRLAVARVRPVANGSVRYDLLVMKSSGAGAKRIVRNASDPAWAPSGKSIAFFHEGRRGFAIYRVPRRGGKLHKIKGLGSFEDFSTLDWVR